MNILPVKEKKLKFSVNALITHKTFVLVISFLIHNEFYKFQAIDVIKTMFKIAERNFCKIVTVNPTTFSCVFTNYIVL